MIEIIPTIFSTNKKDFERKFKKIVPLSNKIQIDFMDGKFVSSTSVSPSQVPSLKNYEKNFEAHLMTKNPQKYFHLLKSKGFKKIIFHYEAVKEKDISRLTEKIHTLNLKCFLAINPETNIKKIFQIENLDGILLMGVHPGKEKQKFIRKTYKKIKLLKKQNPKIIIQIDGGINPKTASKLSKLNVKFINTGSFVSKSDSPKEALQILKNSVKK